MGSVASITVAVLTTATKAIWISVTSTVKVVSNVLPPVAKALLKGVTSTAKALFKGLTSTAKAVSKVVPPAAKGLLKGLTSTAKAVLKVVVFPVKVVSKVVALVVKAVWKGLTTTVKAVWKVVVYDKIVPPSIVKKIYLQNSDKYTLAKVYIRTTSIGDQISNDLTKIVSPVTAVVNGMLVKHWWLVGKAREKQCDNLEHQECSNHPYIWYHFGFNKPDGLNGEISFGKFDQFQDADLFGRKSAGNTHEEAQTLQSKIIQAPLKATIYFAEKFDGRYDLTHNNCQTFAQELYDTL